MGGGTNDRGSSIFAICESEGVRQGDGFGPTIGDDADDVDLDAEVGEGRVRSVFEKGLFKAAIVEEDETSDDEGRG